MFNSTNMHTKHAHVYGSSKLKKMKEKMFLKWFSNLQFDLILALCPFFDRSVFCQSEREVLRVYIFFFCNIFIAFCCLCSPLVSGHQGLRKAGERNTESVTHALQLQIQCFQWKVSDLVGFSWVTGGRSCSWRLSCHLTQLSFCKW